MKEKFNQWKRDLRIWLSRRHGQDNLNNFLLLTYIVMALAIFALNYFLGRSVITSTLRVLSLVVLLLAILRFYSPRNNNRRRENNVYLGIKHRWLSKFRKQPSNDPYRYFTCRKCKQRLRVPKGRGKVEIKCPKCGHTFDRKT